MADNPDEWFDVVDERDLVQRAGGDLFLQKRSLSKDSSPGLWDSSASGHLDSGEDYHAAAHRELREELGVAVAALEPLGRLEAGPRTGMEFVRIYRAVHEGPFTLHPEEIETGRWIAPGPLREWLRRAPRDFAPCFHAVWRAAGGRLG